MKQQITIQTVIERLDQPDELMPRERELLEAARAAVPHSYAPYSQFRVSAAVLLDNGAICVGTNLENAAYPMCLCAERVAIGAAHAQFPGTPIQAIAITVQHAGKQIVQPAAPCGACRQVICEMEQRFDNQIVIILQGETGPIYRLRSGKDLLPLAFDGTFLQGD